MSNPLSARRRTAVAGLAITLALLIPGLLLPVLTIRGELQPAGIASLAPELLEQGLSDEAVAALRPMINPMMLPLLEMTPGGLRGALVTQLGDQLTAELADGQPIEVYTQTRSILGSVQHLYRVDSRTAATLILLFSVIVPFTKGAMVLWAVLVSDPARRQRVLKGVEVIAKWSMADVFAVALFIAFLAAQATQPPPGGTSSAIIAFTATFGPGFYWFAAYCLVSLATQQLTARWLLAH